MQQTTNYQLCQWDPEDFIFRTDFNADNAKIDAALLAQTEALAAEASARTAADMRVLLLATQAGIDLGLVTLDVTGVDFTPYLWAELVVETKAGGSSLYLKPDNVSSYQACDLGGTPYTSNEVAYGEPDGSGMSGMHVRMWSYPNSDRTHFLSARINDEGFTVLHAVYPKPLNEIQELDIWASESGGIPAGSRIRLYGVKR